MPKAENSTEKSLLELMYNRHDFIFTFQCDLKEKPIIDVFTYWGAYERKNWKVQYKMEILALIQSDIIPKKFASGQQFTVDGFRHIRHLAVIEYIKTKKDWPENKKVRLVECYNEFLEWLNRISFKMFEAELPSFQMSLQAAEQALTLTLPDWRFFIEELEQINKRDALITLLLLQCQKRVSQVLKLTIDKINFENCIVQYKSKNKSDAIKYEAGFMKELQEYIKSTTAIRKKCKIIFITRTGKPVTRLRLNYSFTKACKNIDSKPISPESLRGIYAIFIQQKYKEKTIMQSKKERIKNSKKERIEYMKRLEEKKKERKKLELLFNKRVPK